MFAQSLAELWYRPPRLAYALVPIGLLYRSTSALRYGLYRAGLLRRTRLDVPVVIVGNIAVGGTGKTPLTVWLAENLYAAGLKPAVVCRSYAASATSPNAVSAQDDPSERGDEAVLLATRLDCPVWSGPDRAATARVLLAAHAEVDVIVCDDGLQHYALARDCEIAVIDGTRGFGNGLLLPAGPLREPPSRLRSVDAIVINGNGGAVPTPVGVPRFSMTLNGKRFRSLSDPSRVVGPDAFAGKRIAAIAGIGNPARFFDHLRALGLAFTEHRFADHYRYNASELEFAGADFVLMTEKDGIKCAGLADARMWVLPVAATLSEGLIDLVLERVGALPAPRVAIASLNANRKR